MSWAALQPQAWEDLDATFDWVRAMKGCVQDPEYHAEGDVWIHTRMVLESLENLRAYAELRADDRRLAFAAALLHDVAKPECTRVEDDGRITSRGHSRKGEVRARRILWDLGVPLRDREHVAQIVRFHQLPFFLVDQTDAVRRLHRLSQLMSPRLLALVAEADARGRTSATQDQLLTNIELFRALAEEEGCFDRPFPFANDHSRVEYFRREGRSAHYQAHEPKTFVVVVLSGLPGSGKDHWLQTERRSFGTGEVICLDDIRRTLKIDPSGPQGRVIDEARAKARRLLRTETSFVWNATNLSRDRRAAVLSMAYDYGARVRIEYIEVPPGQQRRQNEDRADKVPLKAVQRMFDIWEVPDRTEAHTVRWNGEPAGW